MAHLSRVAVWNNPSCSITYFDTRDMEKYGYSVEDDFIAWYAGRLKQGDMSGFDYTLIDSSNIPKDRSQRGEWSKNGAEVIVDQVKVSQKESKEDRKKEVLRKLNISKSELMELINK